ncbi:MAG: tetratricopeptide repeat protein [Planctomycetota bacterium]
MLTLDGRQQTPNLAASRFPRPGLRRALARGVVRLASVTFRLVSLLTGCTLLALVPGTALAADDGPSSKDRKRAAELNELGVGDFVAGRYSLALSRFQEATQLDPGAAEIRANLGKAHAAVGAGVLEEAHRLGGSEVEYRLALEHFEKSQLHWQGDADLFHAVGICHLELRELEAAERAFGRAVALDDGAVRSWRLLGVARDQRGSTREALAAFERALALRPDDDGLQSRVQRLRYDLEAVTRYQERRSTRFRILYPPTLVTAAAEQVEGALEGVCADLEKRWGLTPIRDVVVICYPPGEFARRTGLHEEVGGAFDGRIRIAFPTELAAGGLELEQVARHEAVHLCLHRLPIRPPRWLDEGLAQLLDRQDRGSHRLEFEELVRRHPDVGILQRERSFRSDHPGTWAALYLHGYFFVRHLSDERGAFRLDMVVREVASGSSWDAAFVRVHGESIEALDRKWRQALLAPR